jgi:hypothetical protein
MKQLPLLKYNNLWSVMCLDHRNNLNGVVVDDASLETMLHIEKTMQRLEENPDAYNAYIEEHLPYTKRDGKIKRADLNRICPCYKTFDNPEHVMKVLEKQQSLPYGQAAK